MARAANNRRRELRAAAHVPWVGLEADLRRHPGREVLRASGTGRRGKNTALRLLAGLDKLTSGEIRIGGTVVNGLAPGQRDIAMVFQNYALYPRMSVYRNLAYGLRQRRTREPRSSDGSDETADLLEIGDFLDRKPGQLSGGQRQRVAMGRVLVRNHRRSSSGSCTSVARW